MNALFKLWVDAHTSIFKFVCSIDNIIENIWIREGDEDMRTTNETPQLWSKFQLEVDARRVYTRKVFSVFKELLKDSTLGILVEKERELLYEVRIDSNPLFKNWKPESYSMKVDKEAEFYSCNCKGFEFEGLLCPHALKVMWLLGVQHLPSHYIVHRWCKGANLSVNVSSSEDALVTGGIQASRISSIKSKFYKLVEFASKEYHACNILEAKLEEAASSILGANIAAAAVVEVDEVPKCSLEVHDPPISQCKGRKKRPARWKIPAEKAAIKPRKCSCCGLIAKHNSRTCPQILQHF